MQQAQTNNVLVKYQIQQQIDKLNAEQFPKPPQNPTPTEPPQPPPDVQPCNAQTGGDTTASGPCFECPPNEQPCNPGPYTIQPGQPGYSEQFKCTPIGEPCDRNSCPPCNSTGDTSCDCINAALSGTLSALNRIADAIEGKYNNACDSIYGCIDEIIDKIKSKIEGPLRSCDECKQMLANGLGGTLEYAVLCSGACIEETAKTCSMGEPSTWDKPCTECGEPCCVCNQGICEPTECPKPPEETPKTKFVGWCFEHTGSIIVRKQSDGPMGPGWTQVALGEDEQAVATETVANCKKTSSPPPGPPQIVPISVESPLCDITKFYDISALRAIASSGASANMIAGMTQAGNAIGNIGAFGINLSSLPDVIVGFGRLITGAPAAWSVLMLQTAAEALGCPSNEWLQAMQLLANIHLVGNQMGMDFGPFTTQIQYALAAGCRQKFLDPDKAVQAFLADSGGTFNIDAHWAIAGLCNQSLNDYIQAAKSKPVPSQLASMRRRGLISQSEYNRGMREVGYLEQPVVDNLFKLSENYPSLSDIVRFMVRDANDESIEFWPQSDEIFKQKYGKELQDWARFQGIPDTVAKFAWRAHWQIPSPSQLFEFWHRLRYNPAFGGKEKMLEQIKSALTQQDILPFWHDHYLAISFRPLGVRDVRRAYQIGALKDKDVLDSFINLGYSDENSEILRDFNYRLKILALDGHKLIRKWTKFDLSYDEVKNKLLKYGYTEDEIKLAMRESALLFADSYVAKQFQRDDISKDEFHTKLYDWDVPVYQIEPIIKIVASRKIGHKVLKSYAIGMVDRADAINKIIESGIIAETGRAWLDEIEDSVKQANVVACQRGIKRRYLSGDLDKQESVTALINSGTVLDYANNLVSGWDCEKTSIGKTVTAVKLCGWLERGAISSTEFTRRLTNIGYSKVDASLMLDDCLISISARRLAEAKRVAKEDEALQNKMQAAQRRQAALAQRVASQQLRATQKAIKTKEGREKQLLSAAAKIEKKCGCDVYTALVAARDNSSRVQREYGLTIDETLQVLLTAAETWDGGDVSAYDYQVNSIAVQYGTEQPVEVPIS